ncbi:MAG TPA: MarR family transcriptional regulator [Acetobacteraceae bacterium]|nr:MarR family transcriptional regulator [Acetobacteraceae bacterium]
MAALRKRVPGRDLAAFGAVFALRTAAQQVDNAINEWMAGTAGTPARFQILALLWASGVGGMPHKEIVQALQVTRATVSGLMAALERDGLVKSAVDRDDRRNLIANLTSRGRAIFEKAIDGNLASMRVAFATLSAEEQETLTSLLQRLRQGFIAGRDDQGSHTNRRKD